MRRILAFAYGVACYAIFLAVFLYSIGFVGNFGVPKSLDSEPGYPLSEAFPVNLGLLGLFAVQHSVMARRGFKEVWTRLIPKSIERSTYVLLASLILALLFWQWRPVTQVVWAVELPWMSILMAALFWLGWATVLVSTFMINHFDLFGLRQVFLALVGREYAPLAFTTPGFYKLLRHPIMFGFLVAFWFGPVMTVGHLLFAVVTTAYILFAIRLEEADLLHYHGTAYEAYQQRTSMIFPLPKKSGPQNSEIPM